MLSEQMASLAIAHDEQREAFRIVARYTSKLCDGVGFAKEIKVLCLATRKSLKTWKRWSDNSYYWNQLWRAMVDNDPVKWGVRDEDVKWVNANLGRWDRRQLSRNRHSKCMSTKRLGPKAFAKIVRILELYCKSLAWTKLRFIATYDQGTPIEDLIADLRVVAIKTIRRYEETGDKLLITNFSKRAVHNHMVNLIYFHTNAKRKRLKSIGSAEREYETTTISLTEGHGGIAVLDTDGLIESITRRLGTDYEHYARAILGMVPDFDGWVRAWSSKDPSKMRLNELGPIACQWAGIPVKLLQENLGGMLA